MADRPFGGRRDEEGVVQFLRAVVPAVGLLLLWELGKLIARRAARASSAASSGVR